MDWNFWKKNPFDLLFIQTKPSATLLIRELKREKRNELLVFSINERIKNVIQPWKDEGSIKPIWSECGRLKLIYFNLPLEIFRMKWAWGILNSKGYVRNFKKTNFKKI